MATTNKARTSTPIFTHEGARAARIGAEAQLYRTAMACLLFEDDFYEDGQGIAVRLADGVAAVPLETAAAVAVEAREQMHLRHVPLLIVREMARRGGGAIIGDTLARVIQRPDELAEFLAIYWRDGRVPLSAQVKRGLAWAFTKFDMYSLAKWNRTDREIQLRDVLFLSHAKPQDEEQAALWKQLVDGTLPTPNTWEARLSSGEDKLTVWTELIRDNALGGLAVLRNLRNMEQAGVPRDTVRAAIAQANFRRVLPFRFIAAARYAPALEPELEAAMFRATAEMEKLSGKTVLLVDHSASMRQPLSAKSDMTRFDAAAGVAMLAREICDDVSVYTFSNDIRQVPSRRGFALRDALAQYVNPTGTLLGAAKRHVDEREGEYARIIVVTDEQSADQPTAPLGRGYVVNVATARNGIGYGAWTHVDGWSEAVLRYVAEAERAS